MNPIPAENLLAGDPTWSVATYADAHEIEGYADRISARTGDTVAIHASSTVDSSANWILYRIGWYGGAGARRIRAGGPLPLKAQPTCPMEPGTGLIRCSWTTAFSVDITPEDVSGLYAVKLIRQDGKTRFIPLVVNDNRPADLLFQASVHTYEAYNAWGGESFYRDDSRTLPHGYASKVSFDRPFDDDHGLGQMLKWEVPMARFLERNGYDVSYGTNVDVGTGTLGYVDRAGMFLSVGHDEYWAAAERDLTECARDEGVPLAFFSANTGYWRIRYEDRNASGVPRTLVVYKQGDDPIGSTASGLFRGASINKPENALLGVMYENTQLLTFPFVASDVSAWLFEGTGFQNGDSIPGAVGFEYDRRYSNEAEPPSLTELGRSPLVDSLGRAGWSNAVSYRASSGALVFAGGSIFWSVPLDAGATHDARAERMTANVLHEGLSLPVPAELTSPIRPIATVARMGPIRVVVSTVARGLDWAGGVARVPEGGTGVAGTLVVALPRKAQIAVVLPGSNEPLTVAGDGVASTDPAHDGIPGLDAEFHTPVAVAADSSGTIYVADSVANVIRRVDARNLHVTTTLAGGLGLTGMVDATGIAARFSRPSAIALDPSGSTLYVADTFNHRIRAVNVATGAVTTVAGSVAGDRVGPGATALFSNPTAVAVAPDGRIFVIETGSRKVKVIYPDSAFTTATLVVGGDGFKDGTGKTARLAPQAGAAWASSFLAFSDGANLRVRALVPGMDPTSTEVYTLAFSGRSGSADGTAGDADIALPMGIASDSAGNLYVADAANGTIRAIRVVP